MSFYHTILQEAIEVFHTNGIASLSEQQLIKKLNVSDATFYEFFDDKEDLLLQAVTAALEEEREQQSDILNASVNAVEEIMALLKFGIYRLKKINPLYFQELVTQYPAAWELYMDNSREYTLPLIADIVNRGTEQGLFCNNLNIDVITRLILGQVNVLLDQNLFPASDFMMSETYKSVYLYLIRGICTPEGVKVTEKFFSLNSKEKTNEPAKQSDQ